jgi:hypothetical protein
MNILEVVTAANGLVKGGADYGWQCFGPNAKYIDIGNDQIGQVASVIFDSDDGTVYAVELFYPADRRAWRWVDDRYYDAFIETCFQNDINPRFAYESVQYEDIGPNDVIVGLGELTEGAVEIIPEDEEDDAT